MRLRGFRGFRAIVNRPLHSLLEIRFLPPLLSPTTHFKWARVPNGQMVKADDDPFASFTILPFPFFFVLFFVPFIYIYIFIFINYLFIQCVSSWHISTPQRLLIETEKGRDAELPLNSDVSRVYAAELQPGFNRAEQGRFVGTFVALSSMVLLIK